MENKLVPYQAIEHIPCTHALVLAPHPDDEVFGCGGAIMRHIERGISVSVIVISDGAHGVVEEKILEYKHQRQTESIAAAQILGYGEPIFWQYQDRRIDYGEKLIGEILTAIRNTQADLVYAPSVFEMHPDHRMLGMAAVEAVRRIGKSMHIALYEIGIPLRPNQLLDISDLVERKAAAMSCFVSQIAIQPYDQHIAALNRYRSYTLPVSVTAAEAYILLAAEQLANDPLYLYQSEHTRQRALGVALDNRNDLPLVSVIIRSIDRPTLSDALDSIALQTYANIEVIVVNAKGANHREIDNWCGRFPLRMVGTEEQAGRSRAANIGLQESKGNYLIFLDDDDWFEADHIERLVQAIINHADIKVVYSGTKCVDENNHPLPTQFTTPFNSTQLIAGNYIPIHSALFSRELLDLGCSVDESLELFEDWDFWLQASTFTDFLFIDKLTAAYRISRQSGFGVNADARKAEKASLKIYNKWLPRLQNRQLVQLMSMVRQNRLNEEHMEDQRLQVDQLKQLLSDKEQHLKNLEQYIRDQEQQFQTQNQRIHDQDRQIKTQLHEITNLHRQLSNQIGTLQEILASNSWKITRPLRALILSIRWLRALTRRIVSALRHYGGIKGLAHRIGEIVRQEGIKSLANKLTRFLLPNQNDRVNSYRGWISRYDTLSDSSRAIMCSRIENFEIRPLISLILPIYNPKPEWLAECIESVRKQIYPHWELCIVVDASTASAIRSILDQFQQHDARIKVEYHAQKPNIPAASNRALEIAQGEWIALLSPEDSLSEHALFWVADALQKPSDVALIYSDEDKIDEYGNRSSPYFKCNWNRELFYSHNMIEHLSVFHAPLIKEIGGFRAEFSGSQNYDLALRIIERISASQIHHIPRILYHLRTPVHNTQQSIATNSDAILAGKRALDEHFQRQHIHARAEFTGHHYRVRYALPDPQPLVTLIIPTRNGLQLLSQCIDSIIEKTTYKNYEILVVDNNSDDAATLQYMQRLELKGEARILRDNRPFNYSALNNNAVKFARGEFIGLLNNDVEVISSDWLSEMLSIANQPETGAVGARLWYPDDTLQHGGVILGLGGLAAHSHKHLPRHEADQFVRASCTQNLSAVTAACLVIRKSIYEKVGGLEEKHLQVAFNDVDFCLRVQDAGYRNVWTPYAELYHHESATRGYEDTPEKKARFHQEIQFLKQRWGDALLNDPAYNPNLTLNSEDFSLADPPRIELLTS